MTVPSHAINQKELDNRARHAAMYRREWVSKAALAMLHGHWQPTDISERELGDLYDRIHDDNA